MLMFFNFPAQRAYIAHTKDGFIPTRNSPSLLKCECVWEKHKSPVLVARNSHFFSDSATGFHTRTVHSADVYMHKQSHTWVDTLKLRKHTNADPYTHPHSWLSLWMRASGSYHWYIHKHKHAHKFTFFLSSARSLSSLSCLSLFNPQIITSSQLANKEAQSRDQCLFSFSFLFFLLSLFCLFPWIFSLLLQTTNIIYPFILIWVCSFLNKYTVNI